MTNKLMALKEILSNLVLRQKQQVAVAGPVIESYKDSK